MNPFQFTLTCDVCGGEGAATSRTSSAAWTGATISHSDPRVCRDVLARKRREVERLAEEIKTTVGSTQSSS